METVEFEGWHNCVRLHNETAEVIVTTAVGPRIVRYGFLGGPNAFHVIPATRGKTGGDTWLPYGGHRLWAAPEAMPRSYSPDNEPVDTVTLEGNALHVGNAPERATGIQKELEITLAPQGTQARVLHRLTNHNVWPVTLAVWGLSIVANGGRVIFPQEAFVPHDDDLLPARPLVLWKFTQMGDPRWRWGSKYLSLRQEDALTSPQKVGLYNSRGWAAHVTPEQVFVVQIAVAPGGPSALADDGCNFETYTAGPFQELETLGPLQTLEPGQSATHVEHWSLAKVSDLADNDAVLDARLLPLVQQAQENLF